MQRFGHVTICMSKYMFNLSAKLWSHGCMHYIPITTEV